MPETTIIKRSALKGTLALVCVIATWSCMPVILKHLTRHLDAWTMMGMRFTLAACFWLPLLLRNQRLKTMQPGLWRAAILPAAVFFLGHAFWTLAPYFNKANLLMFIGRTTFLFSLLFSFLILPQERARFASRRFWAGALLTLGGIGTMFLSARGSTETTVVGLLIMLIVAVFWSLYGVVIRRALHAYPARLSFSVISLYCMPGFMTLMLLFGDWERLFVLSPGNWALLLFGSVVSVALGQVLSYTAIQTFGPILAESAYQMIPFVTLVVAYFALGERMAALQWWGGVVIVAGSACLLSTELVRKRGAALSAPPGETLEDSTGPRPNAGGAHSR